MEFPWAKNLPVLRWWLFDFELTIDRLFTLIYRNFMNRDDVYCTTVMSFTLIYCKYTSAVSESIPHWDQLRRMGTHPNSMSRLTRSQAQFKIKINLVTFDDDALV